MCVCVCVCVCVRAGEGRGATITDRYVHQSVECQYKSKSPTIMPLATEGWSSIHTVVDEKSFWEIISRLKELGAQGILVMPIEKMIL